jgi:hypothetical protein
MTTLLNFVEKTGSEKLISQRARGTIKWPKGFERAGDVYTGIWKEGEKDPYALSLEDENPIPYTTVVRHPKTVSYFFLI